MNLVIPKKPSKSSYHIPESIKLCLELFGFFSDATDYDITRDEICEDVLAAMGIESITDVHSLGGFFNADVVSYNRLSEAKMTYRHIHPLYCIFKYFTKNPDEAVGEDTFEPPSIAELTKSDLTHEPRVSIVDLPPMPKDIADWFKWRYEVEVTIEASGAGRILRDANYAKLHPEASLKVKAMIIKGVAKSNGYLDAQFILPDDITTHDCGYEIWQHILKIFETGPMIGYHLEQAQTRLQNLECSDTGITGYTQFIKAFLSLKTQYDYLYKTAQAKSKKIAAQYAKIDWNNKFQERIRRSECGVHLNGIAHEEMETLEDTLLALLVRIQEREHARGDKKKHENRSSLKKTAAEREKVKADQNTQQSAPATKLTNNDLLKGLWSKHNSTQDLDEKAILKATIDQIRKPKSKNTSGTGNANKHKRRRRTKKDHQGDRREKVPRIDANLDEEVESNKGLKALFDGSE